MGSFCLLLLVFFFILTAKFPKPKDGKSSKNWNFQNQKFFRSAAKKNSFSSCLPSPYGRCNRWWWWWWRNRGKRKVSNYEILFGWAIKCHGDDGSDGGSGHGSNGVYYFLSKHCCYAPLPKTGIHVKLGKRQLLIDLQ